MKIKTADLVGPALDWAVAKAEGCSDILDEARANHGFVLVGGTHQRVNMDYNPSTDWSQGGPLIDKYSVEIDPGDAYQPHGGGIWNATIFDPDLEGDFVGLVCMHGDTILIAAMRAIVAAELGEEVDVPDELLEG